MLHRSGSLCYSLFTFFLFPNPSLLPFFLQKTEAAHENHKKLCSSGDIDRLKPPRELTRCFKNVENTDPLAFKSAFILIFDFEALQRDPEKPCPCTIVPLEEAEER